MQRALVTGLGAVTPFGVGVTPLWDGLLSGRSAVRALQHVDASDLTVRIGGEVPEFTPGDHMDARAARRMDRFAQFAVAASREAVENAGLDFATTDLDRVAVVINTGGGGLVSFEGSIRGRINRGQRGVPLLAVPLYIPNMASSQVSIALGITGPTITGTGACAAGVMAVLDAVRLIEMGVVDVAICGATEALLTPVIIAGFAATGALSERNDDPAGACRPFSTDRDGTVLAEGACVMVLESEAHAVRRGARAIAQVAGGGLTSDAHHVTAPQPDGRQAARAISQAIGRAELQPGEIEYFAAHATGSRLGDEAECRAIEQAFGDAAATLQVSSTKSIAGHLIGAAGALSALSCVLAIRDGRIPPSINITELDPACALPLIPRASVKQPVRAAIANGLAFGGQNAAALFRAIE